MKGCVTPSIHHPPYYHLHIHILLATERGFILLWSVCNTLATGGERWHGAKHMKVVHAMTRTSYSSSFSFFVVFFGIKHSFYHGTCDFSSYREMLEPNLHPPPQTIKTCTYIYTHTHFLKHTHIQSHTQTIITQLKV